MIELDTVIISTGFSGLIGLCVALYVRYFTKPTHEKVFQSNRNTNLDIIFNQMELYGSNVDSLFEILTRDFGELSHKKRT